MYHVVITPSAQRQLDKLERHVRVRILAHIRELANNPRPSDVIKLTGTDAYRIRVGDYRIVYTM